MARGTARTPCRCPGQHRGTSAGLTGSQRLGRRTENRGVPSSPTGAAPENERGEKGAMTKSIVVKIDGREALPVRAIPFFFNWQEMTPDVLAKALCGKHKDWKISAYTLDNTEFHAVQKENWGFAKTEIDALEEILHDEAVTEENHAGYAQWQAQAPLKFPAGVFVWREALEEIFASINKNEPPNAAIDG